VRWYEAYFGSIEWRSATLVSFLAATLTMIVSTTIGTLAAYSLRNVTTRLFQLAFVVFMLPLIIPAILIAIGVFLFYAQIGLNNTLTGIVLAHSVMAIPLVVITVAAGLRSYDMNQELVARSLGASRPWAFLTVTLPQIRISVISAALLAFITSLDEVVIALFIAGGDYATLT
jgi:putative spermidine/putrescine transport system permease protein